MLKALVQHTIRLYIGSAKEAALRLFAPHGGFLPPGEPLLDWLVGARGAIGISALFVVNTAYGTDLGNIQALPWTPSLADSWVFLGAPGVILLLSLVALYITRRGHRGSEARRLLYPVRTAVILPVLTFAFLQGASMLSQVNGSRRGVPILLDLLAPVVLVWCLIFICCAAWCCAAGAFRAADGHPLLAPTAFIAFSWLTAAHVLTADEWPSAMPHAAFVTVVTFGPATVTGLSVFEIWKLYKKYPDQFPFRDGPLMEHPPAVEPSVGVRLVRSVGHQLVEFGQRLKEVGQSLHRAHP